MNLVEKALDKAIDVVQEMWHQGELYVYNDNEEIVGSCVYGAICLAAENMNLDRDTRINLERELEDSVTDVVKEFWVDTGKGMMVMAEFNDDPSTTKEDVIQVLKEAKYRSTIKEETK